jgi:cytochrome c oxidase subunit 1
MLSSAGASILAVAYVLPLLYLGWSLVRGRRASTNAWGATGLEWTISSPPPENNFDRTPVVVADPYSYDPERHTFVTQEGVLHAE